MGRAAAWINTGKMKCAASPGGTIAYSIGATLAVNGGARPVFGEFDPAGLFDFGTYLSAREPARRRSGMETTPRSGVSIGLASALTALNVVVAGGFSIAGLIKPELVLPAGATPTDASAIFALYAAARTIPLALVTMVAIYKRSASALLVLGLLAGIIQFADAAAGLVQHDVGKSVGPLFLAILQMYAVTVFWKASKATSN
jgi:hypothetical protein